MISFNVESFSPLKEEAIRDAKISVKFTKEVSRGTILDNVFLVFDNEHVVNGIEDLSKVESLVCVNISYEDRTVKVFPVEDLKNGRYVLIIRGHIKSVEGEMLLQDLVVPFIKEEEIASPIITYPITGTAINELFRVDFSANGMVRVQVSTDELFSRLVVDKVVNASSRAYVIDGPLKSDMSYYIRVLGQENKESNIVNVYVKSNSQFSNLIECEERNDAFLESKHLINYDDIEVEMFPSVSERVYTSYNRIMLRVNKANIGPNDFKVILTRVYDFLDDEDMGENTHIKSTSYLSDGEYTYVVIEV